MNSSGQPQSSAGFSTGAAGINAPSQPQSLQSSSFMTDIGLKALDSGLTSMRPPRPSTSSVRPIAWMRPPQSCAAQLPRNRGSSKRSSNNHRCTASEAQVPTALVHADTQSMLRSGRKRSSSFDSDANLPQLDVESFARPLKQPRVVEKTSMSDLVRSIHRAATPQRANKTDIVQLSSNAADDASSTLVIKPKFTRHVAETAEEEGGDDFVADASKLVPTLTREGYFTSPSLQAITHMPEAELKQIDNFEVGRHGFGSVKWPGITDVRGLDLDKIISIGEGTVTMYPDDSQPAVGTALNKEAVISLQVRRTARSPEHSFKLQERIQHLTEKAGHKFISYDLETWIFAVKDFDH